jgi:hypothetical protein
MTRWGYRAGLALLLGCAAFSAVGGQPRSYPIAAVPFTRVRLTDTFWAPRLEINRTVTIPFGFKKSEQEGRIRNFERAAHKRPGPYEGKMPFDDTDVYKLIEGASYSRQSHPDLVKGYAVIARTWSPGDVIALDLPMPVRRVLADDRVADDRGKVALERGPLVYCAEAADNGGSALDISVPDGAGFTVERRPDLLGGVSVLRAAASTRDGRPRQLTAIPYYAWSNRGPGEMAVWFARKN